MIFGSEPIGEQDCMTLWHLLKGKLECYKILSSVEFTILLQIWTLKSNTMAESRPNRFKSKGSSFATTVTLLPNNQVEWSEPEKSFKCNISSSAYDAFYLFCAGKHPLAECLKVNAQQHEQIL